MSAKLAGTISIPKGSYLGSGDAVMFIRVDNQSICDKIVYVYDDTPAFELESDDFHHPLKVTMSCHEACVPSMKIYYKLEERK